MGFTSYVMRDVLMITEHVTRKTYHDFWNIPYDCLC
jgi:hypothetical protein